MYALLAIMQIITMWIMCLLMPNNYEYKWVIITLTGGFAAITLAILYHSENTKIYK